MRRKTFIYLSVTGAVATSFSSLYCHKPGGQWKTILGRPEFLSHICDAKTILGIGNAYRLMVPAEMKTDQFADLLMTDKRGNSIPGNQDSSSIVAFVNQNIEMDFKTGQTIVVSGWVLSVTEARQCALFSLA
jgi:hypothetical protein